jgi:hypothetical protein
MNGKPGVHNKHIDKMEKDVFESCVWVLPGDQVISPFELSFTRTARTPAPGAGAGECR